MKSHIYKVSLLNGSLHIKFFRTSRDQITVNVNEALDLIYEVGKKNVKLITETELNEEYKDNILWAVCVWGVPSRIGDPIAKRLHRKLHRS